MKELRLILQCGALALALAIVTLSAPAQPVQLVTTNNFALVSASGGGDSLAPVISRDGRYVLFSSSANNLATNTNGAPFPAVSPARLNVFLRDRTNGTTTLVSVSADGSASGNGDSFAIGISTNGRFALFESSASNLMAGDNNNFSDVFMRDVVGGTTTLVSVSTNGGFANGLSRSSIMTSDGRYVAFVSAASNLVSGDLNGIPDIFVRDLQAGTTTLASVGATNIPASSSESPDISADGRYVAFFSTATNLVAGKTNSGEVYVRDLVGGVTILASTNAHTIGQTVFGTSNIISYNQIISDDGQFVAFQASSALSTSVLRPGVILRYSLLTGLTDTVNTNGLGSKPGFEADYRSLDMTPDGRFIAFVTNMSTTALLSAVDVWDGQFNSTTLVSGDTGNAIPFNSDCYWPQISADGRYVSFFGLGLSLTTNLTGSGYHLYVRDTVAGATTLADVRLDGAGPVYSPTDAASLSADGRVIAFESIDSSIAANDSNRGYDVFVRDLTSPQAELVSARLSSLPSITLNGPSTFSSFSVSTNARYVAFLSEADNLVPNDTNGCRDVFVHDLLTGTNVLVSAGTNGLPGNNISTDCAISGNGRYVAFTSSASNLVSGDNNVAQDVFLRDLQGGFTSLISRDNLGDNHPGNAASYSPAISADGRYVLYHSRASNLAAGFSGTNESLFWLDTVLTVPNNIPLVTNTAAGLLVAAMTPDGRYVAYGSPSISPVITMYVWDMHTHNRIYTNATAASAVALSPDGKYLAYATASGPTVFVADLIAHTNLSLGGAAISNLYSLQFSANGRFLVFNSGGSGKTNQVVLFDSQSGTTNLVSKSSVSAGGGNASSDSPTVSSDGQFVAYRSFASDIVPGDSNGVPDIFLYNRLSGDTTLMSSSQYGSFSANNRSFAPVFSSDAQTLLFVSGASDLAPLDFNQGSDLFAFGLSTANIAPSFSISVVSPNKISWPAVAGKNYQVQFKNNITDASWQVVNGNTTIVGNQGYITDLTPSPTQKFYRVFAY